MKVREAYRSRREPEAVRVLGSVYWSFLITFLALVMCGSIGFGAWEFMKPIAVLPEETVNSRARKVLTKVDLQKILQAFDERAQEFDARKDAPIPVRDPS